MLVEIRQELRIRIDIHAQGLDRTPYIPNGKRHQVLSIDLSAWHSLEFSSTI